MPIGRIRCAYCMFEAESPEQMDDHREDRHEKVIDAFKENEIERNRLRRYKESNFKER